MRPLTALLLSDGKPGHYHQAEGVLAAIARLRPLQIVRLEARRRFIIPKRVLLHHVNAGTPPRAILRLGYGIRADTLPPSDLVVTAGNDTLAANCAAAQVTGAANIYCGQPRRLSPEHVRVVLVYLQRMARRSNFLVAFPPSPPVTIQRGNPDRSGRSGDGAPPRMVAMLVGGNSRAFRYSNKDWRNLTDFMRAAHRSHSIRWIATTSRRTGPYIADALEAMAVDRQSGLTRLIDYRIAGPGAIPAILASVDAVLCTDDSTTMLCEAVASGLPVIGLRSLHGAHDEFESEFRENLAARGWYRWLEFGSLSGDGILAALATIKPRTTDPLDELAASLRLRLPEYFPAN